ncbi:MAG TPA: MCP four helix bundle domain-containing protein [Polyangiaceae bacterium]|jgi:methyl-accepting chemotaxis protein
MLDRLSEGARFGIALGVMAVLVLLVAFSGRLGLRHVEDTTQEILVRDAHIAERALEARASTLQLRRFEKDYFLNIGDAKEQASYLGKWKNAKADLESQLTELDNLISSDADHDTLKGMRADLDAYSAGFDKVGGQVRGGEVPTPQAANVAIRAYKDQIRRLETTAAALGGQSDYRMRERVKILDADASNTSNQMSITAALAIAVAVLMAFRFSRGASAAAA